MKGTQNVLGPFHYLFGFEKLSTPLQTSAKMFLTSALFGCFTFTQFTQATFEGSGTVLPLNLLRLCRAPLG
jgi:hypothetical protein